MSSNPQSRRSFLSHTTRSAASLVGAASLFQGLPRVAASETKLSAKLVRLDDHIEPLVRLIEETPRQQVLERVAEQMARGRSYQQVLAAVLLAGVRNVQPRPSVGFKFHCVLVVNSCHLASMAGPDEDRWLPIFWAIDYFKSSQADESKRSGWHLHPVNETAVPSALQARAEFKDAMDNWDVEKADAATAGLVRTAGATEVFESFARYAARDYRSIGHKAIYLANAWRTLQVIGWNHAEPVLRSLAFALLNHRGEPNPSTSDLDADRPWRVNAERIADIPAGWLDGKVDDGVPVSLMNAFRDGSPQQASEVAIDALKQGAAVQSIWDGVFVGSGELLMRQPGIIGLHGLTTANAMHYLWQTTSNDKLRQQLLLQACSFNPMFRESARDRGKLRDAQLDSLESENVQGEDAFEEIFASVSRNRMKAAKKALGYLENGGDGQGMVDTARRILFAKGRDAHDYKFASAVLEDYNHLSPKWRDRFLASSLFHLKGSGHPDSGLVERTRAALT